VAYNIYLIDETATYTVNILATNLHVFRKHLCAYKVFTVSVVTPVISTRLLYMLNMVHILQCRESVFMVNSHCIMFIYSVVKHWLSVVQMC